MAERASETDIEVAQTRLEIERTRAHMEKTLDSIGDRLAPERFKAEAVEAAGKIKHEAIDTAEHLRDAAVEAARAATHEVIDGVKCATREVVDNARSKVRHTKYQIKGAGMTFVDTLKENPIPTAMVGIGLYWLYSSLQDDKYHRGTLTGTPRQRYFEVDDADINIRDKAGEYLGHAREKVTDVREQVSSRASDMKEQVVSKAHDLTLQARELKHTAREKAAELKMRASEKFDRYGEKLDRYGEKISHRKDMAVDQFQLMLDTNPLGVAAMAGIFGLVFGMLLPETDVENRTMGYKREELVSEAKDQITQTAEDLKEKAKQVAASTVETVKEEVKAQGLIPEEPTTVVGDVEAKIQIDL